MRPNLTALLLLFAILTGIAETALGASTIHGQKTASGDFFEDPDIFTYKLGSLGLEPCQGDTIIGYDPATGVLYYVRQNPWSKFDPLGLLEDASIGGPDPVGGPAPGATVATKGPNGEVWVSGPTSGSNPVLDQAINFYRTKNPKYLEKAIEMGGSGPGAVGPMRATLEHAQGGGPIATMYDYMGMGNVVTLGSRSGGGMPPSARQMTSKKPPMKTKGGIVVKKPTLISNKGELQDPVNPSTLVKVDGKWKMKTPGGQMQTPKGTYQFVKMPDGRVLAHPKGGHTGISRGRDVHYAGTLHFAKGKTTKGNLTKWTNNSGHYEPPPNLAPQAGLPMDKFVPGDF